MYKDINSFMSLFTEVSKNDVAEAAINTLFTQYPFVKDAINYYKANGNRFFLRASTAERA